MESDGERMKRSWSPNVAMDEAERGADSMVGWLLRVWGRLPLTERTQVWVVRQFNTCFTVGVVAVILDPARRVVLFRHTYRHRYPWGLPGGFLVRGEPPGQALVREVREESGLTVTVERLLAIRNHPRYASLDLVFVARLAGTAEAARPDQKEVDRVEAFAPDALPPLRPEHVAWIREAVAGRGASEEAHVWAPHSGAGAEDR